MIPATPADKPLVIAILSQSFDRNPSVNRAVGSRKGRRQRIRRLMAYAFGQCMRYGKVYLNEARNACALLLFPEQQRKTLRDLLLDAGLALRSIGLLRIRKVLRREAQIRAARPSARAHYLWFIGVLPEAQGNGAGTGLLRELIAHSGRLGRNVLLETSVPANVRWYERHGFAVYHTLEGETPLYLLQRAATAPPSALSGP